MLDANGSAFISITDGPPNALKSAWTTKTKNMAKF